MLAPGPTTARTLAAVALGATAGAWVQVTALSVGGVPVQLLASAAVVALALGSGGLLPSPPRGLLVALQALLPLGLAAAAPAARAAGRLVPDPDAWQLLLLAGAVTASLPAALAAGRVHLRTAPAPAGEALGALAGVGLSTLVAPWLSGACAALALGLALPAATPVRLPARDGAGALRLVPVALAALGIALGWTWLRPLVDPSPQGALLVLSTAAAAAVLTRPLGPERASGGAILGGLAVAAAWLLLWKGPGLARQVLLAGVGDGGLLPAAVLQAVPLVVGGVLGGAMLGLAWGPRRVAAPAWLGLPAGAALLLLPGEWAPLWLAGGLCGTALVWSLWRPAQAGGLVAAAACAALAWAGGRPQAEVLGIGTWPLMRSPDAALVDAEARAATVPLVAEVGPTGGFTLRVPADRWDQARGQALPGPSPLRILELDGVIAESRGRAAEAETLAGHLGGLLAPRRDRVLVLGDDLGRVLGALLQHGVGAVGVATPSPKAIRAMAEVDPQARARWLDPRVQLSAQPPGTLLATSPPVDLVIEVVRTPWADAWGCAPTAEHLAMVADRLRDDGLYVAVLHLAWVEAGRAPALAAALTERFSHVQAWLPPFGADSLVLVAGSSPQPLDRLAERLAATPALLTDLDASSPEDLASLAITDGTGLRAWRDATGAPLPSPLALGRAHLARPVLHLASLAEHLATPDRLWQLDSDDTRAALEARLAARESFLGLLAEASSGDMEAVFRRARELQQAGGGLGAATLEPLIEPHVADARRSLERARREGLSSPSWDDALRFATTARMLAPTSPRPLVLLGELSLGRGNPTAADQHFAQALELDPAHVPAITGQARAARARGDVGSALAALRRATEVAPRDWRTWQNLGVLLLQEEQLEEGEAALRQAILLTDGREAAPHRALAELMLADGRAAAALLTADRALAVEESGYAWYLRGRAHIELGELELALDDCQRGVLVDPDLPEARFCVGLVQARSGALDQAAETFRTVLRMQPENRVARVNLERIEEELAVTRPEPR